MALKPDLSRLVSLDWTPSEAMILEGLLLGLRQLRGEALGREALTVIDDTVSRIQLQLKRLHWPVHKASPFPV